MFLRAAKLLKPLAWIFVQGLKEVLQKSIGCFLKKIMILEVFYAKCLRPAALLELEKLSFEVF